MLESANIAYLSYSTGLLAYLSSTTPSLRLNTSARKAPLPQAGSKKRESIRNVSCFTKSSIALTSRAAVKTSP